MPASTTRLGRAGTDPRKWSHLKAVVADALEQPSPTDRTALVRRQCGDDPELLRQAESLLEQATAISDGATDAFEDCAENAARNFWGDDCSGRGERLGAYTIVRELGRGGMGAVYLAARADGHFEKEVAIKVLKRGTDTDDIVRRFKAERNIVARLDHPNIARLLDAGATSDGLPYFVMEYVAGLPVTRFVREAQLPIEERLRLFLKICGAVEAAHKKSVIHRDLKPSNILVDAEGEPKLLDFGIAKLVAPDAPSVDVTATAQQHLTPACASPEQARGDAVTPASDIYALGALLFEILARSTPHRFQSRRPSREEIARVICEQATPLPSSAALDRDEAEQLRGSLDAIVLRAMQKDAARRYHSVAAFAEAIRKHLRGEPEAPLPALTHGRAKRTIGSRKVGRRAVAVTATVAIIGAVAAASYYFAQPRDRRVDFSAAPTTAAEPASAKSIAVLPFDNLSSAPENTFFAAGVHNAILTDLAKIADLKVINPASVQHYTSGTQRDLRQVSDQLNVAYVLEGSVQRADNRVRVTAKLTNARTNEQTWAEHYDRHLSDIFRLQSEIAREIANKLRVTVSPSENAALHTAATHDLGAYDLYVRAKEIERGVARNADEIKEQVRLLDEAVTRDPEFVPALCSLARVHLKAYFLKVDPTPARLEMATRPLATATRIAPGAGGVHLAEGILSYWGSRDYAAALEKLSHARRELPNDADVLLFTGLVERRQGHWPEAIDHLRAAASLDPLSANVLFELAETHRIVRQYDEAAEILDRILLWRPHDLSFQYGRAMIDIAARADLRRLEAVANAPAATAAEMEIRSGLRVELALYQRDFDAAEKALSVYAGTASYSPAYLPPRKWYEATIAAGRGDAELAQTLFEELREAGLARTLRNPDDLDALMARAKIDACLGRADEARGAGEEAVRRFSMLNDAAAGPKMLVALAEVYARLGHTSSALDLLERTATMAGGITYGSLVLHSAWDQLREEPRFQSIVETLAPQ